MGERNRRNHRERKIGVGGRETGMGERTGERETGAGERERERESRREREAWWERER